MIENLGIIIVTFNPDFINLKKNILNYVDSAEHIVIIDNSEKNYTDFFSELEKISNKLTVVRIERNIGIAAAQNIGISRLLTIGNIDALLFFDQDSSLTTDQIKTLVMNINELKRQGENVALIGPSTKVVSEPRLVKVRETLSSGSIIPVEIIKRIGGMEDELFIDLVDYEWCWRAKREGYDIYINTGILIQHILGEGKIFKLIGISKPIRLYYQFRNLIQLTVSKRIPISYLIQAYIKLPIKFIVNITVLPCRAERLRYMALGIKEGISKKKV